MILVTGGCGFIGSHLVRALLPRGQKILVLDSMRYADSGNLADLPSEQVELLKFTLGFDNLESIAEKLKPVTQVYHLAAEKHNQSKDRPVDVFRANVEGMHDLIELLLGFNLRKLVFTSSLYAYGKMSEPATLETDPLEPNTIYGITKTSGEHLLRYFHKQRGLNFTTLRLYFIYGPRQYAGMGYKSVIVKNFEKMLAGQAPVIFGDGLQQLDYVYIDDAVRALLLAMDSDNIGQSINISSGRGVSVKALVEQMIQVAQSREAATYGPADWTHGSFRVGDCRKAGELLAWSPEFSLREGLKLTYDWIRGGTSV